ncbi:MAG: DUF2341 domain-containing protein, partial [Petrotogales bacterium]
MKNNLYKNSLVLAVIVLLIMSVIIPPVISIRSKNNDKFQLEEQLDFGTCDRENWWNEDWSNRKKITINCSYVDGDLTNFPILFHNVSSNFSNAQLDGDDFAFIAYDNTTQYNHEIEYYNSTSGELIAWVNITSLDSTSDTILYLYYGNPSASN